MLVSEAYTNRIGTHLTDLDFITANLMYAKWYMWFSSLFEVHVYKVK